MPAGKNGRTRSILLVDDEPDICSIVKKSLDGNGYSVSTFTSPVLALEHFKLDPKKYDVLVSDVRMPQMSGFELARSVKALNPKTKIVFMTAFEIVKSEFNKVLPSSSIDGFLTKPVSTDKLKQVIEVLE